MIHLIDEEIAVADEHKDPNEWVELAHPGIDGTHRKLRRSLHHWEARGWYEVGATASSATDAPPPAKHPRTTTGQES